MRPISSRVAGDGRQVIAGVSQVVDVARRAVPLPVPAGSTKGPGATSPTLAQANWSPRIVSGARRVASRAITGSHISTRATAETRPDHFWLHLVASGYRCPKLAEGGKVPIRAAPAIATVHNAARLDEPARRAGEPNGGAVDDAHVREDTGREM